MAFAIDKLGVPIEGPECKVEADAAKAYAAATNDPVPAHRDGVIAPPVFAVVPAWGALVAANTAIVPPEQLILVVHGEQDMRFHQPIRPGMVLRSAGVPLGVHVKPSGTTAVARLDLTDEEGNLVVEQYVVIFGRGISDGESAGEVAPSHTLSDEVKAGEPVAVVDQTLDDDQTFRYADASGDRNPIHLDDDIARSVGLPGRIIHGLCTMAFTSWAVVQSVADGDSTRLKRLAVRFSRPVLPGQTITTRIWSAGEVDGRKVYGFETTSDTGDVVIKDGLAEVSA